MVKTENVEIRSEDDKLKGANQYWKMSHGCLHICCAW